MAGIRKIALGVFWLIAFILILIGVADNSSKVALTYLDFSTPELSIAWWILIAFMSGALVGAVFSIGPILRGRMAGRRVKRELSSREGELASLRKAIEGAKGPER